MNTLSCNHTLATLYQFYQKHKLSKGQDANKEGNGDNYRTKVNKAIPFVKLEILTADRKTATDQQ